MKSQNLTRNISKTVTDTRLDLGKHLHVRPTGFQLAPSSLTFDDLEGSKIKVILFDVKYVKNGNSHGVGMWGYTPVGLTGVLVFCLSAGIFVTDISGDEILQDGRYRSPPDLLPFW